MNRITPKVVNGASDLIVSETFCCNPKLGVQIQLPITQDKTAEFHFIFQKDSDGANRSVQTTQNGNILTFVLTNFLSALGASLSHPFEFGIGTDKFFLQLYGVSPGEESLCLTISIFKGQKDG